eukprot:scaffold19862_cov130-Isochrysis_galbana.AAC.3
MPSTGSHRHSDLSAMGPGAWLPPLPAATRAASRSAPTPPNRAPLPPSAPPCGHRPPSPRASRNKPRAHAIHRLPPAPRPPPWGWRCGCGLYPPPPARPAAPHASKIHAPHLCGTEPPWPLIGHLRHAPAAIITARL